MAVGTYTESQWESIVMLKLAKLVINDPAES